MLSCRVHRARCKVTGPLVYSTPNNMHTTTYNGKLTCRYNGIAIRYKGIAKSKEPWPGSQYVYSLPVSGNVA